MGKKRAWRSWLWYFTLITALIVVYKLCGNLKQVWQIAGWLIGIMGPFIGGFALAFLLLGPSRWLEERFLRLKGKCWKRLARPLSLTLVYLLLLGLLSLIIWLVIPQLVNSISGLVAAIPDYLRAARDRIEELVRPGGMLDKLHLAERAENFYQGMLDKATEAMNADNVLTAVRSVVSVTTSIVGAVIAVMVSAYMLAGRERLTRDFKAVLGLLVRPERLERIGDYGHRIAEIFYHYLYGSLLDALVVGVVASVGLAIFRVPYAVLLGMSLGLLNMIPYFGSVFGGIAIVLITLLSKGFYVALGVAVYLLVIQQIDGNIIQPRVVGGTVGLRPIYVLLGITLFGGIFGFWGIFLGVPLMAVIQMLAKDAIARRRARLEAAEPKIEPEESGKPQAAEPPAPPQE